MPVIPAADDGDPGRWEAPSTRVHSAAVTISMVRRLALPARSDARC